VQDDVTTQIVTALALNLSPADRKKIASEHTDNLEAYDCFLRGRELWWKHARETNREAETLFRRAIELDPGYAPAYASLAAVYGMDFANGWSDSPEKTIENAVDAARRGMQLDERNPFALSSLSMSCLWARRLDEAVSTAETMTASNPSFAEGHVNRGIILHYVGRSEEALECFDRAVALDPYIPSIVLHFRAQATYQLGRYPETIALLRRRILRNPETDVSRLLLAASYGQMGMKAEAAEAWQGLLRVNPTYSLEHRRKVLPYKNPDDYERVIEGLRKAGLVDLPLASMAPGASKE
jgi:adenylate cyclase